MTQIFADIFSCPEQNIICVNQCHQRHQCSIATKRLNYAKT